jgi:hypothetical protein
VIGRINIGVKPILSSQRKIFLNDLVNFFVKEAFSFGKAFSNKINKKRAIPANNTF